MSDTVILALITAVSAILVAVLGVVDRHQLAGAAQLELKAQTAELARPNAT